MATNRLQVVLLLGLGAALTLIGLWRLFGRRPSGAATGPCDPARPPAARAVPPSRLGWLAVILAVAFLVRFEGLERRSMSHVEVYVPGIALPAGVSEPPPRLGLKDTVAWHFHDEPHPQGYYFFMWLWTKVFGTGLTALRMPSVLSGVVAVALLWRLGTLLFGPTAGLTAAALLALNGHQVYWSQHARMYAPSTALALLSALLLVTLLRSERRQPLHELAYIVLMWSTMFTQLIGWGLLAGQIVATGLYARTRSGVVPVVLRLQALIVMLGTPMLAHAVYRSREIDLLPSPVWVLLRDFAGFGFLFEGEDYSIPERMVPLVLAVVLSGAAVALLVTAWRTTPAGDAPTSAGSDPDLTGSTLTAVGMTFVVLGVAAAAWRRQGPMSATAALPLLAAAALWACDKAWPVVTRITAPLVAQSRHPRFVGFLLCLSVVPMLLLASVHSVNSVITSRGAIIFVPFLLLIFAAGLAALAGRRVLAAGAATLLLAGHLASLYYFRAIPSPNDYRAIARMINAAATDADLVFVPGRNWVTTPMFYDLRIPSTRIVGDNFAASLAQHPGARVWLPLFSDQVPGIAMERALEGYAVTGEQVAFRGRLQLYVPRPMADVAAFR